MARDMAKTPWGASLLLALGLLVGCTTTGSPAGDTEEVAASREISFEGYQLTVPADIEIHRTVGPAHEHGGGLMPTPTWRSTTVYPGAIVLTVPHRRGWLVLHDPDTESHTPDYLCWPGVEERELLQGSTRRGFVNGIPSTETSGESGPGSYFRTVTFDRREYITPAGLQAHYEDASHHTRKVFDGILASVRRL
jgi:hypothetical protein